MVTTICKSHALDILSVHRLLVSTTFGCLFDYPPSSSLIGQQFLSGWMGVGGMYQDMPVFQDPFPIVGQKIPSPGVFMDHSWIRLCNNELQCVCVGWHDVGLDFFVSRRSKVSQLVTSKTKNHKWKSFDCIGFCTYCQTLLDQVWLQDCVCTLLPTREIYGHLGSGWWNPHY